MNSFFKNLIFELKDNLTLDDNVLQIIIIVISKISDRRIDKNKSVVSNKNEELNIDLFANSGKRIHLNIILWKNVVNLYCGDKLLHFADDVFINDTNDLKKLEQYLLLWLSNDIEEILLLNKMELQHFIYSTIDKDGMNIPFYFSTKEKKLNQKEVIKKTYKKWIAVRSSPTIRSGPDGSDMN